MGSKVNDDRAADRAALATGIRMAILLDLWGWECRT